MSHKHKWVDTGEPDSRLPLTYYRVCSKCSVAEEDGYGRINQTDCIWPDSPSWINAAITKVFK